MNNDQLEDLKQFIDVRISQTEARFDTVDEKFDWLDKKLEALRKEMLDGFAGVGDVVEDVHKLLEETKTNFEERVAKIEQQATLGLVSILITIALVAPLAITGYSLRLFFD